MTFDPELLLPATHFVLKNFRCGGAKYTKGDYLNAKQAQHVIDSGFGNMLKRFETPQPTLMGLAAEWDAELAAAESGRASTSPESGQE